MQYVADGYHVSDVALGANTTYTHTITNDDVALPTVSFTTSAASGNEGNSGTQTITVNASLSSAAATTVTVPIEYSGTATLGNDFYHSGNLNLGSVFN